MLATMLHAIEERLRAADRSSTRIVAVSGPDCSGKTLFAAALADHLSAWRPTAVVHVDDFHNERAVRYSGPDEVDNYLTRSINFTRLEREVLRPLKETGRLDFARRMLDIPTDTFSRRVEIRVEPGSIVVVEGVFLLQRSLAAYWDFSVFLLVDRQTALHRGLSRDAALLQSDVERRYVEKYLPAQARHMVAEMPHANADLLIDNNDFEQPILTEPTTAVLSKAGWR